MAFLGAQLSKNVQVCGHDRCVVAGVPVSPIYRLVCSELLQPPPFRQQFACSLLLGFTVDYHHRPVPCYSPRRWDKESSYHKLRRVLSCCVRFCEIASVQGIGSCRVMSRCYVMACHVTSRHLTCHVISCHVMSCHVRSGQVRSGQDRSGQVTSRHVMSCHDLLLTEESLTRVVSRWFVVSRPLSC